MKQWSRFSVVATVVWLCASCTPCPQEGTQLVIAGADWIAQDFADSQGVISVRFSDSLLIINAHLVGGDPALGRGEIYIDLRYWPPTEALAPLDLSGSTIAVRVILPEGYGGPQWAPSGIQVFVKDDQWRSQYGLWVNVANTGGEYTATLSPSASNPVAGMTAEGFDPTRVRIIGVKFGINDAAIWDFAGNIIVQCVNVMPDMPQAAPPDLPADAPPPVINANTQITVGETGYLVDGAAHFLAGANWRGIEYGQNFGVTLWFPRGNGFSRHPGYAATYLDYARRTGLKVLRVGLLDDGRTLFDREGYVEGYNDVFQADVRTLLDLARAAGCRIEFVLTDFLIAGHAQEVEGVWLRGREEIFEEAEVRGRFVTDFLVPFLEEFGAHPGLFGFDLCNEPEWIISKADGGAWEDYDDAATRADHPVPVAAFGAFVDACAAAIREHAPGKPITVGASFPFISLVADLDTDYLAFHHYGWMDPLEDYVPLLAAGRVWCLEEFPTRSGPIGPIEYLETAHEAGAAGVWLWNLTPGIDPEAATFDEMRVLLPQVRAWIDGL